MNVWKSLDVSTGVSMLWVLFTVRVTLGTSWQQTRDLVKVGKKVERYGPALKILVLIQSSS